MKPHRLLVPLCALALWGLFCCKAMPKADPGGDEPYGDGSFGGEEFGGYDYEGWDLAEGDEDPSLALPPGFPPNAWSGDLIEPSLETGEAFLPDFPPEDTAPVLAEPLPEPAAPDLPELAEEPSPGEPPEEPGLAEEPSRGEPPDLAGEPPPEEPPGTAEEAPEEAVPPPPPRIVRPSEPVPPPPPVREAPPMPPNAAPDLPARNPPALTPAPAAPPGVSSRVVRALAGQTVEVPFRGTGWVYLGESSSKRGADYASRRLDPEGQTFVFRAGEAGVYELKFYRQDFIRDYIINDMVTLIVEAPPPAAPEPPRFGAEADRGVAVAEPRWPVIAGRTSPEAGAAAETRAGLPAPGAADPAGAPAAVPDAAGADPPAPSPSRDMAAEEYMRRAREEYQEERYPQSMAILDQFLARFPLGSDEAYWLYAQLCEKQGPSRDIRLALDYYRRLVAEYPQSGHYNDARRRIAYLERYYINIQ